MKETTFIGKRHKEMVPRHVGWMELAQDNNRWRALVNERQILESHIS